MSRRICLAFVYSLLGIVVVLSLMAQGHHQHKGPGSTGTSPTTTVLDGGSSTAGRGGTPRIECPDSPLKLTFTEREKNVDCSGASFDYSGLLKRLIARRGAAAAALNCAAACPVKTVVDRNFRTRCNGSVATAVLDTEIYCTTTAAPVPGPGITLPPTTTTVTSTAIESVPGFQPFEKYEDTTLASICPQLLIYTYREKVDSCANRLTMWYDRYIDRAIEEAKRYSAAVTCVPLPPQNTCNKLNPPIIVWTSWDCTNNEVVVQVAFVTCVP